MGGAELKRFFIVFVAPRILEATKMVKKWFSKGTDKNGKKMVKTFFLATKLDAGCWKDWNGLEGVTEGIGMDARWEEGIQGRPTRSSFRSSADCFF